MSASIDPRTLQTLIDASIDGVLVLNADDRIEYANPAAARLLGRPLPELLGTHFGFPVVTSEKTEIELSQAGSSITVELRVGEAHDAAGSARRIVQLRDVTDAARRLDEALAGLTARTNALNMIAHELRSPLSVIVGYASMLEEGIGGELTETAQKMITQIATKAAVLREAVEQLLAAARLGRSAVSAYPQQMNLLDVMKSAVERNRPKASLAGATLRLSERSDATLMFRGDPDHVGTVLDNLIGNAITHCPAPAVVDIFAESAGDGAYRIIVSDNGPGVGPEDRERIFEAFERAGDQRTEGTGLGLAISRELAGLSGCRVELLPSEEGACFALTLPRPGAAS